MFSKLFSEAMKEVVSLTKFFVGIFLIILFWDYLSHYSQSGNLGKIFIFVSVVGMICLLSINIKLF